MSGIEELLTRARRLLAATGSGYGAPDATVTAGIEEIVRAAHALGRQEEMAAWLAGADCPHPDEARGGEVFCTACGEDVYRGCGSVKGMWDELVRRGVLIDGESGPVTRDDMARLLDETSPAAVAMQRWARDAARPDEAEIAVRVPASGPLTSEQRDLLAFRASEPPPGPLQAEGTWTAREVTGD